MVFDYSEGLIVLDKPSGPTSHQSSAYLKEILGIKKAGHSGTLDPNVSGVLPVAFGRSTRLLQFLLLAPKEYVCWMKLHGDVSRLELSQAFKKFKGEIKQRVPRKSAVKRQTRKRTIYELELLEMNGRNVLFRALVERGTYIRMLCIDIGKKLGVQAHMYELRRTKVAHLDESISFTLNEVKAAKIEYDAGKKLLLKRIVYPKEKIVEHLPKIVIYDDAVSSLLNGISLKAPGIKEMEDFDKDVFVKVFDEKNELIMIGKSTIKSKDVKKVGVVVLPEVVFN